MEKLNYKRLESLDVLRGFDLFCLVGLESVMPTCITPAVSISVKRVSVKQASPGVTAAPPSEPSSLHAANEKIPNNR